MHRTRIVIGNATQCYRYRRLDIGDHHLELAFTEGVKRPRLETCAGCKRPRTPEVLPVQEISVVPRIVRRVLARWPRAAPQRVRTVSRHRKPHESQCAACRRVSWFGLLRTILGATYSGTAGDNAFISPTRRAQTITKSTGRIQGCDRGRLKRRRREGTAVNAASEAVAQLAGLAE